MRLMFLVCRNSELFPDKSCLICKKCRIDSFYPLVILLKPAQEAGDGYVRTYRRRPFDGRRSFRVLLSERGVHRLLHTWTRQSAYRRVVRQAEAVSAATMSNLRMT